ncbi:unnamed protein product [Schistosoma curassoni]|uniref:t-SNARE coiled-coil homology domain-containing protein n=1 Tax=Schistosoma curassoni TaxID=6186 RepID=A0A183JI33_9TREM|nr:unnamed protein product [Schistosoma curassoni]
MTYTTYQRAVHCLQAAHRCRIQPSEGPWEQSTKKCEAIIDGLKALLDLLNNPPKSKNDNESNEEDQLNTFIQSTLATLRISLKSVISKLKIAEESILSTDVQDMIRSSLKDLNELLIDVEKKLN